MPSRFVGWGGEGVLGTNRTFGECFALMKALPEVINQYKIDACYNSRHAYIRTEGCSWLRHIKMAFVRFPLW